MPLLRHWWGRCDMRFSCWPYGEKYTTVEALERDRISILQVPVTPLEPLSLFGEDVVSQIPKRSSRWSSDQRYRRDQRARKWRRCRRFLAALTNEQRQEILASWASKSSRFVYAGTPEGFEDFLAKRQAEG